MFRPLAAAIALCCAATPAAATLPVGAKAPNFTTQGAIGGNAFRLNLAERLKRGPVVLYFFPKAFTQGCTVEANAFAEATDDFARAGATVIGLSADGIEDLKRFSTEECRDKFAVATATPEIIRGYDVALTQRPGMTNRTSYIIGRDGRIAFVHSDMKPLDHVRLTLAKVQQMRGRR